MSPPHGDIRFLAIRKYNHTYQTASKPQYQVQPASLIPPRFSHSPFPSGIETQAAFSCVVTTPSASIIALNSELRISTFSSTVFGASAAKPLMILYLCLITPPCDHSVSHVQTLQYISNWMLPDWAYALPGASTGRYHTTFPIPGEPGDVGTWRRDFPIHPLRFPFEDKSE